MFQLLHLKWLCIVVPIFGLSGRRIPDPTHRLQSHLRCSLVGFASHQMLWSNEDYSSLVSPASTFAMRLRMAC